MKETLDKKVRVRFAPSPTGPFSIGNARTALFNWLFAKNMGGDFLIRIENTDKERSLPAYEKQILDSLEWLGLTWDGKPIRQSDRTSIYEKYLTSLIDEGIAYYCFCTPEELDSERQAQLSQGLLPQYSGRCRSLAPEEASKKLFNKSAVIRFKVPEQTLTFSDSIRGKISVETKLIGDIIIAKTIREPLYNFAAAVDDVEMNITHVIRGEDHLSNTPKQILIHQALGVQSPQYAHLPLILGQDKKKLSKRFLTNSILDYRAEGYLVEAVLNFLVLMGWHPSKDREVLSVREMIDEFTLKRVQKGGAVYNSEKLEWLNSNYIRTIDIDTLAKYLEPFIPEVWLKKRTLFEKILLLTRDRMKILQDFIPLAQFFFELDPYPPSLLQWKGKDISETRQILEDTHEKLKTIAKASFTDKQIKTSLEELIEKWGRGEVLWPFRVALSGKDASPPPFEIAAILGRDESLRRLSIAMEKLHNSIQTLAS